MGIKEAVKPYIDQEIKIGEQGWFFDLVVFETREQMEDYRINTLFNEVRDPACMGAFHPLTIENYDSGEPVIIKTLGQMVLNREDVSLMIVCHESAHAAFACMRRIEQSLNFDIEEIDDHEETFCYYAGDIAKCVLEAVAIRLE